MKQPKKLKRDQKIILSKNGLDCREYMLKEETADSFTVIKKDGSKVKSFKKNGKPLQYI